MIFFQINGLSIAPPKDIMHSYEVLDKVERTMDGTMVVDLIGKKQKVDVSWSFLTRENMIALNNELSSSSFVTISYRDINTGTLISLSTKPKDFTYSPSYDWVHNKVIWRNVSISFEER